MSMITKKQKIDSEEDDEQSPLALLFTAQWREIFEFVHSSNFRAEIFLSVRPSILTPSMIIPR